MRLRKVAYAEDMIDAHPEIVIPEPTKYKAAWKTMFDNNNPIYIEIGMGKGKFILESAKNNPGINYIGIEKAPSVLIRAVQKLKDCPLHNVRLLCVSAEILKEIFVCGEVDRIYLNFPDPWPKSRHEKRRLTNKKHLDIFKDILSDKGEIHFKTDNEKLFQYSIIEMSGQKLMFTDISFDCRDNIQTEYEEKFLSLGKRIYFLQAVKT